MGLEGSDWGVGRKAFTGDLQQGWEETWGLDLEGKKDSEDSLPISFGQWLSTESPWKLLAETMQCDVEGGI